MNTPPPARAGTPTALQNAVFDLEERYQTAAYHGSDAHDVPADAMRLVLDQLSALTSANAALAGECRELRKGLESSAGLEERLREVLRQIVTMANVNPKTREMLVHIGNNLNDSARAIRLLLAKYPALPPTDGAHAGEK